MIKFFRRIRFNLMEQNKTGKYLKYAIGEIVLVVIGILIALQLNNWNESEKEQADFNSYIEQLKLDVETAIQNATRISKYSLEQSKSCQDMIDFLLGDTSRMDFNTFKTSKNLAGRHGIVVLDVGYLGELLAGNIERVDNDKDLIMEVHKVQNSLEVDKEVLTRWGDRLSKYQKELKELTSQRYIENYPKKEEKWLYDYEYLSNSSKFLESNRNLVSTYEVYGKVANRAADALRSFKTYLEQRYSIKD